MKVIGLGSIANSSWAMRFILIGLMKACWWIGLLSIAVLLALENTVCFDWNYFAIYLLMENRFPEHQALAGCFL